MKKVKFWAFAVIAVLLVIASVHAVRWGSALHEKHLIQKYYRDEINAAHPLARRVTMVDLLSNPQKYDGKLIRVIGVGNLEFEGDCIALSKEDLKFDIGHQIWIELGERAIPYSEAQTYNGKYVIVEGIFDMDDTGHMGMFQGAIKDVNRYDLWFREKEDATE